MILFHIIDENPPQLDRENIKNDKFLCILSNKGEQGVREWLVFNTKWAIFSSTFRRKKVELLSSLGRQRLGRLSFLSESISQKLSKVSIWNLEYLFTIKRGTNYNKEDDPVICISRVICPCFDIVHRN